MAEPIGSLRAEISATSAKFSEDMAKIQARLDETNNSFKKFGNDVSAHGTRIEKQLAHNWEKLTSGTELVVAGLRHISRGLEALIVIESLRFIEELVKEYLNLDSAVKKVIQSNDSLIGKAAGLIGQVNPLILKTNAWAEANYNVAQAQYKLLQLDIAKQIIETTNALKKQEETAKGNLGLVESLVEAFKGMFKAIKEGKLAEFERGEIDPFKDKIKEAGVNVEYLRAQLRLLNTIMNTSALSFKQATADAESIGSKGVASFRRELELTNRELPISNEMLLAFSTTLDNTFVRGKESALDFGTTLKANFDDVVNAGYLIARSLEVTTDKFEELKKEMAAAFATQTFGGIDTMIISMAQLRDITEQQGLAALSAAKGAEILVGFYQAAQNALASWILGQQSLGKALKTATAQVLASVAARAAVEALYMTGIGIAALTPWGAATYGPAPFWFKAAAVEASIAAITGAAAAGISGGGGGGTGGTSVVHPSATEQVTPTEVNITIEGSALMDSHTLDLVLNSAVDKIGSILNDRSGRAGPIKIHTTRL